MNLHRNLSKGLMTSSIKAFDPNLLAINIADAEVTEGGDLIYAITPNIATVQLLTLKLNLHDQTTISDKDYATNNIQYSVDNGASWITATNNNVKLLVGMKTTLVKVNTKTTQEIYENKQLDLGINPVRGVVKKHFDTGRGTILPGSYSFPSIIMGTITSTEGSEINFPLSLSKVNSLQETRIILSLTNQLNNVNSLLNLNQITYSIDGGLTWLPSSNLEVIFPAGVTDIFVNIPSLLVGDSISNKSINVGIASIPTNNIDNSTPSTSTITIEPFKSLVSVSTHDTKVGQMVSFEVLLNVLQPIIDTTLRLTLTDDTALLDTHYQGTIQYSTNNGDTWTNAINGSDIVLLHNTTKTLVRFPSIANSTLNTVSLNYTITLMSGAVDLDSSTTGSLIISNQEPILTFNHVSAICGHPLIFTLSSQMKTYEALTLRLGIDEISVNIDSSDYSTTITYSSDQGTTWTTSNETLDIIFPIDCSSVQIKINTTETTSNDDKILNVKISEVISGTVANISSIGIGTIVHIPMVTINDVTVVEGSLLNFTVALDTPTIIPITLNLGFEDQTAITDLDYIASTGTNNNITIPAGQPYAIAPVTSIGKAQVTLLMNLSEDIVSDSTGKSIVPMANTVYDNSFSRYINNGSAKFDGSEDCLWVNASPDDFTFSGNFTIEAWIYLTSEPRGYGYEIFSYSYGLNGYRLYANKLNGPGLVFYNYLNISGTTLNLTNGNYNYISKNAWHHVAITRNNNRLRMFINGSIVAETNYTHHLGISSEDNPDLVMICIGGFRKGLPGYAAGSFQGHINGVRVVKDKALYTENFTPSTTPLTYNIISDSAPTLQTRDFKLKINSIVSGQVKDIVDTGIGTINSSNLPITFSISDAHGINGQQLIFSFSTNVIIDTDTNIQFAINPGTASPGTDYFTTPLYYSFDKIEWDQSTDFNVRFPGGFQHMWLAIDTQYITEYSKTCFLSMSQVESTSNIIYNDIGTGYLNDSIGLTVHDSVTMGGSYLYMTIETSEVLVSHTHLTIEITGINAVQPTHYGTAITWLSVDLNGTVGRLGGPLTSSPKIVTMTAGTKQVKIRIPTVKLLNDTRDRQIRISVISTDNSRITDLSDTGLGTISYLPATLTIADISVNEGDDAIFTIQSNKTMDETTIQLQCTDGSSVSNNYAITDIDYLPNDLQYYSPSQDTWITPTQPFEVKIEANQNSVMVKIPTVSIEGYNAIKRGYKRFTLSIQRLISGSDAIFTDTGICKIIDTNSIPAFANVLMHFETIPFINEIDLSAVKKISYRISPIANVNNARFGDCSLLRNGYYFGDICIGKLGSYTGCFGFDVNNIDLSGDFTIESWLGFVSIESPQYIFETAGKELALRWNLGKWELLANNILLGSFVHSLPYASYDGIHKTYRLGYKFHSQVITHDNDWHHIAVVCSNNVITCYLNGENKLSVNYRVLISATQIRMLNKAGWPLVKTVNTQTTTMVGFGFLGFMDELLISSQARYLENFTPPIAPYSVYQGPMPTIHIGNSSVYEGSSLIFPMTLTTASDQIIKCVLKITANTAIKNQDYVDSIEYSIDNGSTWIAAPTKEITIPIQQTSIKIKVPTLEYHEQYIGTKNLSISINNITTGFANKGSSGIGYILETTPVPAPIITVENASSIEGSQLIYRFSVDYIQPHQDITFKLKFTNDTAIAGTDFLTNNVMYSVNNGSTWLNATNNNVSLLRDTSSTLVKIQTLNTDTWAGNKVFTLGIDSIVSGTVADFSDTATGTIIEQTPQPPTFFINDTSTHENDYLIWTINPSVIQSNQEIILRLYLSSSNAVVNVDYEYPLQYSTDNGVNWINTNANLDVVFPKNQSFIKVRLKTLTTNLYYGNKTITLGIQSIVSGFVYNYADLGVGVIFELTPRPPIISISNAQADEGQNLIFMISPDVIQTNQSLVLTLLLSDGSAIAGIDYSTSMTYSINDIDWVPVVSNQITLPIGTAFAKVKIPTLTTDTWAGNKVFNLSISHVEGNVESYNSIGIGTIIEKTPQPPTLSFDQPTVAEGQDLIFTLSLDVMTDQALLLQLAISDQIHMNVTELYYSVDNINWTLMTDLELPIQPNTQQIKIKTATSEYMTYVDERSMKLNIDMVKTGIVFDYSSIGLGTVVQTAPRLIVNTSAANEGDPIIISITPSRVSFDQSITFTIGFTNNSAVLNTDYSTTNMQWSQDNGTTWETVSNNTLTLLNNYSDVQLKLNTLVNHMYYGDRTFTCYINEIVSGSVSSTQSGIQTIIETTPQIQECSLIANNPSTLEGDDLIFTLSLDVIPIADVYVTLGYTNGTAVHGTDFNFTQFSYSQDNGATWLIPVNNKIIFAMNHSTLSVKIPTIENALYEGTSKTMTIKGTAVDNINVTILNLNTTLGTGTIVDDENPPVITINDVTVEECEPLIFTVAASVQSKSQDLTLRLGLTDGSAIANTDYQTTNIQYSTNNGGSWINCNANNDIVILRNTSFSLVKVTTLYTA